MPRQKEYDKKDVLNRAIKVFWDKGYEATSIQDLVNGMSINRFSIYSTFKNKHELFLQALDEYLGTFIRPMLDELKASHKGLKAIEDYLNKFMSYIKEGKAPNGCLLINTANELGAKKDNRMKNILVDYLNDLENSYYAALEKAKALKQIPANKSSFAARLLGPNNNQPVLNR